jgi:hypothetical protein
MKLDFMVTHTSFMGCCMWSINKVIALWR